MHIVLVISTKYQHVGGNAASIFTMLAADYSKMLVFAYHTIRYHIPEECNLNTHYRKQIISYKMRGFYDRIHVKKGWMECFLHSYHQLYRYGG
jgi:hypothetical protein